MEFSDVVLEQCGQEGSDIQMNLKILWRLLKLMKTGFIRYLSAILIMSVSLSAFEAITAFLLKNIITRAEKYGQGNIFEGLWSEVIVCFLLGLAILIIAAISFYVYFMEAKKGGANLQKLIYSKSMRLPYAYYENTHSGEFMSKIMYDCDMATGIYGSRFRRILMPAIMTICYLIPMFMTNWQVTLCLFGVSAALFITNGAFIAPMQRVSRQMSKTNTSVTEQLSNILSGMEQIKIYKLKSLMVDKYISENERFKKERRKVNLMSACLDGLNQTFELMGALVFIVLGIFFVSKGITTVGSLAAIYVLYGSMSWNLLQVGLYIPSMASYLANAGRVFEFLDSEEEPETYRTGNTEHNNSDNIKLGQNEAIRMQNVTFSYDGRQDVLHDFNLSIEKGKCVAIKGESGKGKTTIAKLLQGFYPIKSGNIIINGKDFSTYTLNQIREIIGFVPQEPYLYDVSIEENIRYGRLDADKDDIIKAAKMANAHEFIMQLENGYETRAGERGNRLSGGQRQRIAIARAILKDAPILILDEATSALDNKSELLVNEALERLMNNRTTIVIAHRQSTLERADEVIEI